MKHWLGLLLIYSVASICRADVQTPGHPFPEPVAVEGIRDRLVATSTEPAPPIYSLNDYNIACEFSAMAMSADLALQMVSWFYDESHKWPQSNDEALAPEPTRMSNKKHGVVRVDIRSGGIVTVQLDGSVPELKGTLITFSPVVEPDAKVKFKCDAGSVPRIYRRQACP